MNHEKANGNAGGADALRFYFSEIIDEHPVLDNDSMMELGTISRRGQEAKVILENGGMTDLSPEEIDLLRQTYDDGMKARNQLVLSNQRLVVSIANKYRRKDSGIHEPIDLIQSGTLGLVRAAEKYDPGRGITFSTYATWWIKQSIVREMSTGQAFRLPPHVHDPFGTLIWAKQELYSLTGDSDPSDEKLSEFSGISSDKVAKLKGIQTKTDSLDRPLSGENDWLRLADMVADPRPDGEFDKIEDLDFVVQCLDVLGEEEREIMLMRINMHPEYNFEGYHLKNGLVTIRAISKELGMSRGKLDRVLEEINQKIISYLRDTEQQQYFHEEQTTGRVKRNGQR